jgi:superfamily I DNA/RNA helicase
VGGHKFSLHFLFTEWEQVIDAWQLENWEAYRDVMRLGRKTRLPEPQRMVLWSIFERVRSELKKRKLMTHAELFSSLATVMSKSKNVVFDFAVVDEAQDISVAHLRFFTALGGGRPNTLFFAGDLGQRIFQRPSLGRPSAWTSVDAPAPCASITALRTKSARRRTVC